MLALVLALAALQDPSARERPKLPVEELRVAGRVAGVEFSDAELALMAAGAAENLAAFERMRSVELANDVAPALLFRAQLPVRARSASLAQARRARAAGGRPSRQPRGLVLRRHRDARRARALAQGLVRGADRDLPRAPAAARSAAPVRRHAVRGTRARAGAALDEELARGHWRGPLHGIPGARRTCWRRKACARPGARTPYREQVLDADAAVVEKLDRAGAVLIAKLSLGELAWGDVWFGGTTKNPWNLAQGSSGSSAVPARRRRRAASPSRSGSETCGSIVSPSATCGATGLRPTYGRVSRRGAMQLAWSMDKLGPICRSVEDAAIGSRRSRARTRSTRARSRSRSSISARPTSPAGRSATSRARGAIPSKSGRAWRSSPRWAIELVPIEVPKYPIFEMLTILSAEAASAFDEFSRTGVDDKMVRQEEQAWPNVFRTARLIPAVDYLRANRLRRRLMLDMVPIFERVDVIAHPSLDDSWLVLENLTGHPTVCAPTQLGEDGTPGSISFTAAPFDESRALALAEAWQRATGYHARHPELR
jgi:Asp-tRNA(Asn)/Glu-tRNA(Gln) amidotransferase A subunit family amidase